MLLILAKYFIWICRLTNETVHITSFYKYLTNYFAIQKYIAKIEGKEQQFDMWNEIQGKTGSLLGERDVPSRLSTLSTLQHMVSSRGMLVTCPAL